ncbi:MAG: type IV secretion system DNA-binding domain-containing protein [Pseudomonadota bacterium]
MQATTILGTSNAARHKMRFGIRQRDRLSHVYIIGKTGVGKSTLLGNMMRQDLHHGHGFCLIDPHGDLVERMYQGVPEDRRDDVLYFNVPDRTQPYGYNPLRFVREDRRALACSGMLDVMKKMWPDAWGVNMEHILRNALFALLETPGSALPDIVRLLDDKEYRRHVTARLRNATVKHFWQHEYTSYSFQKRSDGAGPILNKIGAFLADPHVCKIVTAPEHDLHFRQIMDDGKVLLVNLAKGQIGEDAAGLLGGLLVTTLGLASFTRQDLVETERRDFYLYLDEFQNFTTRSMANMTSELRKYHVGLVLAHQYLFQLDPDVREAVLGNAGTIISFRLGARDAAYLAQEFQPEFSQLNFLRLPNYDIYLRLMIDGRPSKPFSATTLEGSSFDWPLHTKN